MHTHARSYTRLVLPHLSLYAFVEHALALLSRKIRMADSSNASVDSCFHRLSQLISEPVARGETWETQELRASVVLELLCRIVDEANSMTGEEIAKLYRISRCWELKELAPGTMNSLLLKLWARVPTTEASTHKGDSERSGSERATGLSKQQSRSNA